MSLCHFDHLESRTITDVGQTFGERLNITDNAFGSISGGGEGQ